MTGPALSFGRRKLLRSILSTGLCFQLASLRSPKALADEPAIARPGTRDGNPGNGTGPDLDHFWTALPRRVWIELPGTRMDSLVPLLPTGFVDFGAEGFSAVTADWSGAAFDPQTGCLWCSGGGHTGSNNNGLYEFCVETFSWRIAMSPSIYSPRDLEASKAAWNATERKWIAFDQGFEVESDEWRDGKPTATHTYQDIAWLPSVRRVYRSGLHHNWLIDPATGAAEKCDRTVWAPGTLAIYDAVRQRLIRCGPFAYDYWNCQVFDEMERKQITDKPRLNLRPPSDFYWSGSVSGDVAGLEALFYSSKSGRAWRIDLHDWSQKEVVLDRRPSAPPFTGGTYCDSLASLAMLLPDGSVFTIDPRSGRCNILKIAGVPPSGGASMSNGVNGRWRWYPRRECFVLVSSTTENVRLIRI